MKIGDEIICINSKDSLFLQNGMVYDVVNIEDDKVTVHKDNSYIGCYSINLFEIKKN
jgi:hypothetical protein